MKARIIALCVVIVVMLSSAFIYAAVSLKERHEREPRQETTAAQTDRENAEQADGQTDGSVLLTPQQEDMKELENILFEFCRSGCNAYDCEKDDFMDVFVRCYVFGCPGGMDDILQEGVNYYSRYNENYWDAYGLEDSASDPKRRFTDYGFFALREDAMAYYKENIFNNYLPMKKEYCYTENGSSNWIAYYDDGWYYFSTSMGGIEESSKFTSCEPTENGRYRIEMQFTEYGETTPDSISRIEAALVQQDGKRLWRIYKVTPM